jgi:hypothetical protein
MFTGLPQNGPLLMMLKAVWGLVPHKRHGSVTRQVLSVPIRLACFDLIAGQYRASYVQQVRRNRR